MMPKGPPSRSSPAREWNDPERHTLPEPSRRSPRDRLVLVREEKVDVWRSCLRDIFIRRDLRRRGMSYTSEVDQLGMARLGTEEEAED